MAQAYSQIRRELQRRLGGKRLRVAIWNDLVHEGFVRQVAKGLPIDVLVRLYEHKEEDYFPAKQPRRRSQGEVAADRQAQALAQIVAHTLDWIVPTMAEFREDYLGGQRLRFEEVAAWIKEQATREGVPAAGAIAVPVSKDNDYLPAVSGRDARSYYRDWLARELQRLADDPNCELPARRRSDPLRLSFETTSRTQSIAIRADGVLAALKAIAGTILTIHTGWKEADAVTFILTERIPLIPLGQRGVRLGLFPAASQIDLQINPRLSPREAASFYAPLRARFVKGRARPMGDRHLALAVFAHRSVWGEEEISWIEARRRWNTEYPKWRYEPAGDPHARMFSLEARAAWTGVTGSRWPDRRRNWRCPA